MNEQVRQRIESLERELQGLKNELQPKIEVGSRWEADSAGIVEVLHVSQKVHYKFESGVRSCLSPSDFKLCYIPYKAPKPKNEVDSWWLENTSGEKAKVTSVENGFVDFFYENGCKRTRTLSSFAKTFTPCEAPNKEVWYLCTQDYTPTASSNTFKRGKEYKFIRKFDEGVRFEIDGEEIMIRRPQERGIMVSPQER